MKPTLAFSHSSYTTSDTWAGTTRVHAHTVSRCHLPVRAPDTHSSGVKRRLGPNSSTCPPAGTHARGGHTPPSRPSRHRAARRGPSLPGLTLTFPLVRCLFFPPMVAVAAAFSVFGDEVDTAEPELPVPRAGRGLIVATSPPAHQGLRLPTSAPASLSGL